jgi:F0F1-type ATP synthase membrane subunit c/vacuolar-type H+-ATPase subunit K
MEIPQIIGAGLIVIGAGLGIGKIGSSAMDAMLVNQKLQERSKQLCLLQLHLLKVLVSQRYSLLN